ncbi:MAG: GNAT family N-acetyltransferase [Dehalococcoidia bacterium]
MPTDWPDAHDARFLRLRLEQLLADPAAAEWFARAIVLRADPARPTIGHIGYHGPPKDGAVELGYTIFVPWRGCGYATEAAKAMIEAAKAMIESARSRGVGRYILSIAPENAPSLAIAKRLGFKRTGEQMDEEDGLEYMFELTR